MKDLLEKNKWHPLIHPTNKEMSQSEVFNKIMDLIIELPSEDDRIMFVLGLRNSLDSLVEKKKDDINRIINNL